uniref:helix-turn-helix domain-containing protein n=1 Tax=Psychrobacter glacincola TaxID=56810 RepID=UPI001D1074AF|nr:helix-turn-helix domain-containing protein [Psychrobacter glacincola]
MIQRSESHHAESPNHTARHNHEESVTHRSILQGSDEKAILSKLKDGQLPSQGLEHYLQEQERQLIITALKQTAWNKTQAAELLGTTFRSLRYRMKKLEIAEDQFEP